jgi:hypothetical protein
VSDSNFPFQIPFRLKQLADFTNLGMSSITLTSLHPLRSNYSYGYMSICPPVRAKRRKINIAEFSWNIQRYFTFIQNMTKIRGILREICDIYYSNVQHISLNTRIRLKIIKQLIVQVNVNWYVSVEYKTTLSLCNALPLLSCIFTTKSEVCFISWNEIFCSLLTVGHDICHQPSCNNCFYLEIFF